MLNRETSILLHVLTLSLLVIALSCIYLVYQKNTEEISRLHANYSQLKEEFKINFEAANERLDTHNQKIIAGEGIERDVVFTKIEKSIEQKVKTDRFVLLSSVFYSNGTNDHYLSIDLGNQEILAEKYLGYGEYDIKEENLQYYLNEVVELSKNSYKEHKKYYEELYLMELPEWEEFSIDLYIERFMIAQYTNGKLELLK